MIENDPNKWNEEKIWESILDPSRIIHPEYNDDIFEWWEDNYKIPPTTFIPRSLKNIL